MLMSAAARQYYEFDGFRLDPMQRLLLRSGEVVPLTPKVFETLLALVENTGLVVSKDDLMNRIWPDTIVEERCLSQNIFLLRKALGDGSNYVETIPKVGYRFLPSVTTAGEQRGGLIIEKHDRLRIVSSEEEFSSTDEPPAIACESVAMTSRQIAAVRNRRVTWYGVMLGAVLITATCYLWLSSKPNQSAAPPQLRSIAVLPFKPLAADTGDDYLGLGMADTLIGRLSHIRQIVVRPTSAIRKYSALDRDALSAGREQMVDAVLEGSIQRSDERIRVSVQLVAVRDGSPIWSYRCDERSKDIFAVEDSISERVAAALMLSLTGDERNLLTKHQTEDTEAYRLYVQGRYFWNKRTAEGFKKALDYFNQAIEKDPNYAAAYVGVADSYTMLADYDWIAPEEASLKAKAAATRALDIDDSIAEAHATLADIKRFFDWDWADAEREYRRAIELNPNYSTAHQWYAEFLSAMSRHEEAIREMKRAEELDPLSLVVKSAAGWVLFFAREHDQAIATCRKVIEMEPGYGEAYSQLRRAYEQKGMYREALDADEKLRESRRKTAGKKSEHPSQASLNAKAYWLRILELTKQDLQNKDAVEVRLAEAYAQLGEKDRAFELLEKACERHSCWIPFLRVHPNLDPLRSDPRFEDILRRVGLE